MALGPGEYIVEIRFENDMIEFIFTFSPGMLDQYHKNMARQYFSSFSIFFFSKLIKRLGSFFFFYTSYQVHTNLSLRIGLLRPGGTWGSSSSLSREWAWQLSLENIQMKFNLKKI